MPINNRQERAAGDIIREEAMVGLNARDQPEDENPLALDIIKKDTPGKKRKLNGDMLSFLQEREEKRAAYQDKELDLRRMELVARREKEEQDRQERVELMRLKAQKEERSRMELEARREKEEKDREERMELMRLQAQKEERDRVERQRVLDTLLAAIARQAP